MKEGKNKNYDKIFEISDYTFSIKMIKYFHETYLLISKAYLLNRFESQWSLSNKLQDSDFELKKSCFDCTLYFNLMTSKFSVMQEFKC